MIAKILVGGVLLLQLLTPVAAMPKFFGPDAYCTATVTVYSTKGGSSSPSSAKNNPGPAPVTVTVTNVLTSYQTRTIYQTQNVFQTQTVTQVVTRTLAQEPNLPTPANNGGSYNGPEEYSVTTATVTSTLTTTNTIVSPSRAAVPPQPSSRPFYSNLTGLIPYVNSSTLSIHNPVSPTTSLRLLDPPPAPTTKPLASYSSVSSSITNSSSSGYENGLYFANW